MNGLSVFDSVSQISSSVTSYGEIIVPNVAIIDPWVDPANMFVGTNGMGFVDPILFLALFNY